MGLARRFVQQLPPVAGKVSAWLYGSVARGDFNVASDVDVLVVAETLPAHPLTRLELLLSHAPPGVEPKGLTRQEFEGLRQKRDASLLRMLSEAVLLRDDLGLASSEPAGSGGPS